MNTKKWIIVVSGVIATFAIAGMFFFFSPKNSNVFEKDTTINGDFTIPQGKEIITKNGSVITTTGDMTIDGGVSCSGGPLSLFVKGDLRVRGTLHCALTKEDATSNPLSLGLQIVATHVIFEKGATVETSGHIIIVNNDSKLLRSQNVLNAAYDEAQENSGNGSRVGPFVDKKQTANFSLTKNESLQNIVPKKIDNIHSSFIKTAFADGGEENVAASLELRGIWNIGKLNADERDTNKLLLLIDMGENSTITLEDITITGASGRDGKDDIRNSCAAHAENGDDAFRLRINAGHVLINNGMIDLGSGGKGGDAETLPDCENGLATGGQGGQPGNIKITTTKDIIITTLHIDPGISGNGGRALASARNGENSCPGKNGGDATALAGNGGENKKDLMMQGEVTGIEYVQVDRVIGGTGGNAIAKSGNGGNGTNCECMAGNGGNGKAIAGNGGSGLVSIPMSTAEGRGGDGGNSEAQGGNGGNGFSCSSRLPGGNGGSGGNAVSIAGLAGRGTTANGNSGIIKNGSGGSGGNGGSGCPMGLGGSGGTGTPLGGQGVAGDTTCAHDAPKSSPTTNTSAMIKAILYKGKYLPLDQIIVTNEPGCGAEHFRAERGYVKATDGTLVPDADVVCGYGKVSENQPVLTAPQVARADTNEVASTTEIFQIKF